MEILHYPYKYCKKCNRFFYISFKECPGCKGKLELILE